MLRCAPKLVLGCCSVSGTPYLPVRVARGGLGDAALTARAAPPINLIPAAGSGTMWPTSSWLAGMCLPAGLPRGMQRQRQPQQHMKAMLLLLALQPALRVGRQPL